jgi:hypothetical protein
LFRVGVAPRDPHTRQITESALDQPVYADGLLLDQGRVVAVTFLPEETLTFIRLDARGTSGTVEERRTDPTFRGPSTVDRAGNSYLVVNADFETGTTPFTVSAVPRGPVARHTALLGGGGVGRNRRLQTANDSYVQPWECIQPRRGAASSRRRGMRLGFSWAGCDVTVINCLGMHDTRFTVPAAKRERRAELCGFDDECRLTTLTEAPGGHALAERPEDMTYESWSGPVVHARVQIGHAGNVRSDWSRAAELFDLPVERRLANAELPGGPTAIAANGAKG